MITLKINCTLGAAGNKEKQHSYKNLYTEAAAEKLYVCKNGNWGLIPDGPAEGGVVQQPVCYIRRGLCSAIKGAIESILD